MATVGERVGEWVAPWFAAGSAIRHARLFHPVGVVHAATVTPATGRGAVVGRRLAGGAVVRLSGAIWRRDRAPDVLGLAVRFRGDRPLVAEPDERDQDLVLATLPSVAGLPLALLTTDPHDFLANTYTGGSPFHVDGLGRVRLRARPIGRSKGGGDRADRLMCAIEAGDAGFELEAVARDRRVLLARLSLGPRLALDERSLAFSPFRSAAGLYPTGFVQQVRRAVYPESQVARSETSGVPAEQ